MHIVGFSLDRTRRTWACRRHVEGDRIAFYVGHRHARSCRRHLGFTLIEMMIVLSIIGILSVIAGNVYINYTVRAQVAEGLNLANVMTTSVGEYYNHIGEYPPSNASVGLADPTEISGSFVESVNVAGYDGIVTVTYSADASDRIAGLELLFSVVTNSAGIVAWQCRSDEIEFKYLPQSCRP